MNPLLRSRFRDVDWQYLEFSDKVHALTLPKATCADTTTSTFIAISRGMSAKCGQDHDSDRRSIFRHRGPRDQDSGSSWPGPGGDDALHYPGLPEPLESGAVIKRLLWGD